MGRSSGRQLAITQLWDIDTHTMLDMSVRIVGGPEVWVAAGAQTKNVDAGLGSGNSAPDLSDSLVRTGASTPAKVWSVTREQGTWPRFEAACKAFLGTDYEENKQRLLEWHDSHIASLESQGICGFMAEFEESVSGTPSGRQRRSAGAHNSAFQKLSSFLDKLYWRYKQEEDA